MDTSDVSVGELLKLLDTLQKVEAVDLEAIERLREESLSVRERLALTLREGVNLKRAIGVAQKKPKKKKMHWKQRRGNHNRYHNEYYHKILKPRRQESVASLVVEGDWWTKARDAVLRRTKLADRKKIWKISLAEWDEHIKPHIGEDVIPIVFRHGGPKGKYTLDGIYVVDSMDRRVLFDGKDHTLRKAGYIV